MTAGGEEAGGRHARRDELSSHSSEPHVDEPPAPDWGSSTGAGVTAPDESIDPGATQALPVFRREASVESPRVRAVAPRVASALPAIGGEEVRDAPASARANIERRRRAQEDGWPPSSGVRDSASDGAPASEPPSAAPSVSGGTEPDGVSATAHPEQVSAEPGGPQIMADVELVPIGSNGWPRRVPGALLATGGEDVDPGPPAPPAPAPPAGAEAAPATSLDQAFWFGSGSPDVAPPTSSPDVPAAVAPPADVPPAASSSVDVPPPARPPLTPPPVTLRLAAPPSSPTTSVPPMPPLPQAAPGGALVSAGGSPEPDPEPARREVVDAEIIDDPTGEHRAVVDATAAEMVSALTHVAFRDAQTDEWASVSSEAGHPAPGELPTEEPDPGSRPGPGLMEADSWETTSLPVIPDDSYQGRRRRTSTGALTRWLVVIGVVLALSAAVAIPFLMTSGGGGDKQNTDGTRPSDAGLPGVVTTPTPDASDDPYMPIGQASATPSVNPSVAPSASHSAAPSASASASSMALEAESATLAGCAQVRTFSGASGGSIVDRLGDDNDWSGCTGDGVVTFNNVSLEAGNYTVTVYYVFNLTNTDSSRFARLRIDPDGAGSNIDFTRTFARTTTCCQSWTTGRFTVSTGTFDISFTNPGQPNATDRAPAVDRIVIQKV
jgi:hypothetical protein